MWPTPLPPWPWVESTHRPDSVPSPPRECSRGTGILPLHFSCTTVEPLYKGNSYDKDTISFPKSSLFANGSTVYICVCLFWCSHTLYLSFFSHDTHSQAVYALYKWWVLTVYSLCITLKGKLHLLITVVRVSLSLSLSCSPVTYLL